MTDLGGIPLDCASDKDGFRATKECFEVGDDEFCKKDEVEKVGSLSGLGQGKGEIRVVERGVEIGCEGDCGKINAERVLSDNGITKKLRYKGCLIEEDLGKVSLDGDSNAFVLVGALENDKEVDGDQIGASDGEVSGNDGSKSDEMINLNRSSVISGCLDGTDTGDVVGLNKNGMNNRENASDEDKNENVGGDLSAVNDPQINSGNGLMDGGLADPGIVDAAVFEGNGMKHPENVSDENESESESDSESESESLSSSSSSTSSSSDEGDEPEEDYQDSGAIGDEKKSKIEKGVIEEEMAIEECEVMLSDADEMVAWSDDEDAEDGDGSGMAGPTVSKNELKVLPPVPSVTVTLQPHHQTLPIGIILSIMGTQVIVEGIEKHNPLNEGSILWITDGRLPLGMVDEIFGPVENPYYVVRYNSESEVPTGIQQGTSVSFVQEFANHVLNDKNLCQKGYDASGENDEELSDELEFSDDEKEAEYKRMLKMKKRGKNELKPKRRFKKVRSWKCNQVLAANSSLGGDMLQEDLHLVPSITTSLNLENHMSSSALGQGLVGNNAMVSAFAPRGLPPYFCAPNGIRWSNGYPHQQHQTIGPSNELAANVMPWTLQNHRHQLYQMPLPYNMAFQEQISTIPRLPDNLISLGGHLNLSRPPAFGPCPTAPHQNIFNQSRLGMGLQAPNTREQAVQSDGSFHLPRVPVSHGRPQNTNQSGGGNGGRKVHHRGGGHSGGGRGRYRQR